MMRYRLNKDELSCGYSAHQIFEDENCCVSKGLSHTRPIITVNLLLFDIYIIGGSSMREYLDKNWQEFRWYKATLLYLFRTAPVDELLLIFTSTYNEGVRVGKNMKLKEVKEVLELDNSSQYR